MNLVSPDNHKTQLSFELGKKLMLHTPMIMRRESSDVLVSSSLLLKFNQGRYLVMAAHTLKTNDLRELGLLIDKKFVTIGGLHVVTNPDTIKGDLMDIAAIKLDHDFVNSLPLDQFEFFDLNSVNFDAEDREDLNYIAFGYPIKRSKVKRKERTIRIEPFNYRTNVSMNDCLYRNVGVHRGTHQILYYRQRKIHNGFSGNVMTGPDPVGMSGCGIWCVPNFNVGHADSIAYYPTGIVIEFEKKFCSLIGTRLNIVTEILRQNFDAAIPASTRVKTKTNAIVQVPFPAFCEHRSDSNLTRKLSA